MKGKTWVRFLSSSLSSILLLLVLVTASAAAQDAPGSVTQQSVPQDVPGNITVPLAPQAPASVALGTAFTFQGQLNYSGAPVNGYCDMVFALFDAITGGNQVSTSSQMVESVTNGLFSANVDFGSVFTGAARWMDIQVRCPAGSGNFTALTPRTSLNAAPYALGLRLPISETVASADGAGFYIHNTAAGPLTFGLRGDSDHNFGVTGLTVDGFAGVYGGSASTFGVFGSTKAPAPNAGVYGKNDGTGFGVFGQNTTAGTGVAGDSAGAYGVTGHSATGYAGIFGTSDNSYGIFGAINGAAPRAGVYGKNDGAGFGVFGQSTTGGTGVFGLSNSGTGVYGSSNTGYAGDFNGKLRGKVVEITGGADLAERFALSQGDLAEPGTVMAIDDEHPGLLKASTTAYDPKVAGIVSGAGDVKPGLTLHQEGVLEGNTPVAIAGRVYVKTEANSSPIKPGDPLTTSSLPGYAMKATDRDRSQGAILGKAMSGLDHGTGLVLVLVSLQ